MKLNRDYWGRDLKFRSSLQQFRAQSATWTNDRRGCETAPEIQTYVPACSIEMQQIQEGGLLS
jgi:hypothetical protein